MDTITSTITNENPYPSASDLVLKWNKKHPYTFLVGDLRTKRLNEMYPIFLIGP